MTNSARIGRPAARHADRSRQPDDRRGREAADAVAAHKDQAAADKADAGHDLCGDTRRIEHDTLAQNVAEAVFRNQHDERSRQSDEGVGAQTRALLTNLAFDADQGGEHERQPEFADLKPTLACEFAKSHGKTLSITSASTLPSPAGGEGVAVPRDLAVNSQVSAGAVYRRLMILWISSRLAMRSRPPASTRSISWAASSSLIAWRNQRE